MNPYQTAPLVFISRLPREKYQVRFWTQPDLYNRFVQEVEKNDLVIQDVFNQFMMWFTTSSEGGTLLKQSGAYNNDGLGSKTTQGGDCYESQ